MKVIFSHPTGNANARAAAIGLLEANLLSQFQTTIASFPGGILDNISGLGPFSEIRRRQYDPKLKHVTKTWPWMEVGRHVAKKAGLRSLTRHETGYFSVDYVYENLDKRVASSLKNLSQKEVGGVYAYLDGAFHSFREAKKLSVKCFFDQPIGYWRTARRLLGVEQERWPEWSPTILEFIDSDIKLARQDEELRLADKIFVASSFTANSLQDFPGELAPIEVIPYGFPEVKNYNANSGYTGKGPLKLLFVGGLSQRKGIADLFAAVDTLGNKVTLTVVGQKGNYDCPALDTALAKHRWIPSLAHADILELMKAHDVFVFPSLFEGFGLVITEAMSQGTPVITTDRTAGPDLIEHGNNGWLVEAGSPNALQKAIEDLLQNPEIVGKVGKAAMETARKRPWEVYGKELAEAICRL